MLKVKIGEKEYKLRFGYGVLCKTDLLNRVQNISKGTDDDNAFQKMVQTISELFLVGAQKYQKDEFYYDTEDEKEKQLEKVYDLLDDYEDSGTAENPQDGFTLFNLMQEELFNNGFLSGVRKVTEEEAKKQDATILPTDRKESARK